MEGYISIGIIVVLIMAMLFIARMIIKNFSLKTTGNKFVSYGLEKLEEIIDVIEKEVFDYISKQDISELKIRDIDDIVIEILNNVKLIVGNKIIDELKEFNIKQIGIELDIEGWIKDSIKERLEDLLQK